MAAALMVHFSIPLLISNVKSGYRISPAILYYFLIKQSHLMAFLTHLRCYKMVFNHFNKNLYYFIQ